MGTEQTVDVSINGLIDEALQSLTPWQQWAVNRNFKRHPENREKVAHAVELQAAKFSPVLMQAMDAEGFTHDTPFSIPISGKGELLQIIIDNLPAILAAIIKIIGLFGAILFMVAILSQSASAQLYGSAGGGVGLGSSGSAQASSGGSTGSVGYASSGSAASASYGSSGSAAYGSSGSAAASYGSSGSAAVQSYGSSGSAVGLGSSGSSATTARGLRPLRSILENKPIRSRFNLLRDRAPVRTTVAVVATTVASVPQAMGNAYQVALASAQARAASGRRGHHPLESGYTTGVGFSTFDPNPRTCYGVGGNYAVVRGADGWYSTKVL